MSIFAHVQPTENRYHTTTPMTPNNVANNVDDVTLFRDIAIANNGSRHPMIPQTIPAISRSLATGLTKVVVLIASSS
jgi:hypothetical protein